MQRLILAIAVAAALAGCATQFTGRPKVKDGPAGCKAVCEGWGMDLAGMVKMGEYSDGCICQVRAKAAAPAPSSAGAPSSDATPLGRGGSAGQPAVTGVYLQMQAAAAAAADASRRAMEHPHAPGSSSYVPGSPPGSSGWRPGLP